MEDENLHVRFVDTKHDLTNVVQSLILHAELALEAAKKCKKLCSIEGCEPPSEDGKCRELCEKEKAECLQDLGVAWKEADEMHQLITKYADSLWLLKDIAHEWYGSEAFYKQK